MHVSAKKYHGKATKKSIKTNKMSNMLSNELYDSYKQGSEMIYYNRDACTWYDDDAIYYVH